MKQVEVNTALIAYCGLYCGACRRYLKEKCPGCRLNEKATWCKIRTCCIDNLYNSCADCKEFADVNECKKFNNLFAKIFAMIFRSDRKACINMIKDMGYDRYAQEMTETKQMTIKR